MKLSGEAQAELVKFAVIGVAVIGVAWYLKRQVEGAADSALQWVDDLSLSDTFADNWQKAGDTVPFTPMWWSNRAVDAYHKLPSEVPKVVNPASDQNIVYQGVNAVVRKLPGASNDDTLGTWLYNITH